MDDEAVYRIISVDPGSQLAGFTLWEVDIATLAIRMVDCWTEDLRHYVKLIDRDLDDLELRLEGLKRVMRKIFRGFPPNAICTESNFLQKHRVTGYRGLLLTIAAMREVTHEFDSVMEVDIVHVIKAKEFMNAKSNSKEDVHKRVVAIDDVTYPEHFDIETVGPDGLDSIALGYCYIKMHWDQLRFAQHWMLNN